MVKFLRHLLPILSPSFIPPQNDKVISKVNSNHDFYLPFRQHAPSLKNARRVIYADVDRLVSNDGIGFFNILAFRGVFFGSPFAQSSRYRWFDSLSDWEHFRDAGKGKADNYKGEEYYVKKTCYGQSQTGRQLSLLSLYWNKRLLFNDLFDKPEKPTVTQVFRRLTSKQTVIDDNGSKKSTTKFPNIGKLTALLICGDLVEARILDMPSTSEWAKSIINMGRGSKDGMEECGFVRKGCSKEDFCMAFVLLDEALQNELQDEEKEAMGYNIVMLEHALCKIKRIGVCLF
jgi:hypothetical protein